MNQALLRQDAAAGGFSSIRANMVLGPDRAKRATPGSTAPVIVVENLVKRYGATAAVDGASFAVGEGEVFARRWQDNAGRNPRRPPAPHIGVRIGSRVRP